MATVPNKKHIRKLLQGCLRLITHLYHLHDTEKERAVWLNQFKRTGYNPNREEVISKLIAQLEKYAKEDADFFKQLHTTAKVTVDATLATGDSLSDLQRNKVSLLPRYLDDLEAKRKQAKS